MDIDHIPVISVSYNSAELIEDLLSSLRAHYPRNPVTIIDGSSEEHWRGIEDVCKRYEHVRFIHFDYNIHHGPGMAWAFQNLDLAGPVLVLDSDIMVLKRGFLEAMLAELKPGMYGVGYVNHVNEGGFDVDYVDGAVRYLHPACMLVNIEVVRQWPMPTKHGAPMTEPMLALHREGKRHLVHAIDWVESDFKNKSNTQRYIRHDWQGTVKRSGSYNLDDWQDAARQGAERRASIAGLLPARAARKIVEIGANDGMLARAIKEAAPSDTYIAVGTHPDRATRTKSASDETLALDPDALDDVFFTRHADADCWILDQALERSADPALLLHRIRGAAKPGAVLVVCVPNAQHWSLLVRLCTGDLQYDGGGLLSASNRYWFSRGSLLMMLQKCGFAVQGGLLLAHHRLQNAHLEGALHGMRAALGLKDAGIEDLQADEYIMQAVPAAG
jgi:hypothetical protein